MKSWLKFFLPEDEYKERQMLIFLAEAAVMQVVLIFVLMFISQSFIPMSSMFMLTICLFSTILYVGMRYILSGIEYTDIDTEEAYKKQVKLLRVQSVKFVIIYLILAVILGVFEMVSYFESRENKVEFFSLLAIMGVILFVPQYISLRKSYLKNKDLV